MNSWDELFHGTNPMNSWDEFFQGTTVSGHANERARRERLAREAKAKREAVREGWQINKKSLQTVKPPRDSEAERLADRAARQQRAVERLERSAKSPGEKRLAPEEKARSTERLDRRILEQGGRER